MTSVPSQISKYMGNAVKIADIWGELVINVKSAPFLAKGDGVTDDTAAIQAAIDYAISVGKTEITFPAGTYKYTTLTNTEGMTFLGDGVTLDGTTPITITSLAEFSSQSLAQYSNTFSSDLIAKMQNGETVKIICFGDSWTIGDGAGRYPEIMQAALRQFFGNNNITVVNEGHSGWTTNDAIGYIDEIVAQDADSVIMLFGINDAAEEIADETYKSNFKSMVTTLRDAGREVILMSTGPTLVTSFNAKLMYYNSAVREIAQFYNLEFIDIYNELINIIFTSRQVVPSVVIPDKYHLDGPYRHYLSDIILGKMLKNNIPTISNTADFSIPLVDSPYVTTNITTVFSNNAQFYKKYYYMVAGDGTYLRFAFYMDVPGMSLVVRSPKNGALGTAQVYMDGSLVKTISGKANDSTIGDASEIIYDNVPLGYHYIEISAANVVSAIFLSEFQFTKTQVSDVKNYNNASGTLGSIERFKSAIDGGKIRYTGVASQNEGAIFFDSQHLELKTGKTLVMEMYAKLFDGSGFTWFGHRAESFPAENNISGVNAGYAILASGSDLKIYVAGTNNALSAVWTLFGTAPDYTAYHTYRIEMDTSYNIKFYVDGVQAGTTFTDASKLMNDGWCGVFTTAAGTINIDKWDYFYK